MKILAKDLLKKESLFGIPVKTHPAFNDVPQIIFVDEDLNNKLIAKWESENCQYEFVDGEFGLYYDDGVDE